MNKRSPILQAVNTKKDWLAYIEQCHATTIDLGLERVNEVAKRLKLLPFTCPVIMVAGTNGKGSCVELSRAILSAAGYRVATYTSPHLLCFNERIQVGGIPITDQALMDALEQVEKARDQISLTYFEFSTLAALYHFKQAVLDFIILEVGLGGRLDAVNCVDADIAVISTIALDHMQWLGSTKELIAKEKAGILRSGKPCVFGDHVSSRNVFSHATALNSPLYQQGESFRYQKNQTHPHWCWHSQSQSLSDLPLPQLELQNAATVLQVIELLAQHYPITREAIEVGLKTACLPGRFQILTEEPLEIILDVAHNPAGACCLAKRLATRPIAGKTHVVLGMLKDKDAHNTLAPLLAQTDYWYLTDLAVARGATSASLRQWLPLAVAGSDRVGEFASPLLAYQQARLMASGGDRLIVCGSFHTVAPIYTARV